MAAWMSLLESVEALEGVSFDADLVAAAEARARHGDTCAPRPLAVYLPSFKGYQNPELPGLRPRPWPAISITGGSCQLNCDHCRSRLLHSMRAATSPEALWRLGNDAASAGAGGLLLSGGSNLRNEVAYGPFLAVIRRLKARWPQLRIAVHTGLVDAEGAHALADAGVDVAMLDLIGAQQTVERVYHLRRPVEDFEASLAHLVTTPMRVVPHIVVGLHYGGLLGEWRALQWVRRHQPAALVLVVVMPQYASARRPFSTPDPTAVGRLFLQAREEVGELPLVLGCARPPGRARVQIDVYALLSGLDAIAFPAEGTLALAARLGRPVGVAGSCCSVPLNPNDAGLDLPSAPSLTTESPSVSVASLLNGIPIHVRSGR